MEVVVTDMIHQLGVPAHIKGYHYLRTAILYSIEDKTLLVGILTQNRLFEKTVSNMVECKSRGAYLMAIAGAGHYQIEDTADFTVSNATEAGSAP